MTITIPKEIIGISGGVEETYNYKDPETLIRDFFKDVELVLSGKEDS